MAIHLTDSIKKLANQIPRKNEKTQMALFQKDDCIIYYVEFFISALFYTVLGEALKALFYK